MFRWCPVSVYQVPGQRGDQVPLVQRVLPQSERRCVCRVERDPVYGVRRMAYVTIQTGLSHHDTVLRGRLNQIVLPERKSARRIIRV